MYVCMYVCMYVQVSGNQSEPLTDGDRLNLRLDRFSGAVEGEERMRVVAMAKE